MRYGWSGLNNRNNSKQNSLSTNKFDKKDNIIIARVIDIILDESDEENFKKFGEWNSLGVIRYESLDKRVPINSGFAKPLESNIKKLPLINELVLVISAYNTDLNYDEYSISSYYLNVVGLWNHPHHNAFPNNSNLVLPEQNKSYEETELGSFSEISPNPLQLSILNDESLGKTFKERANIHPLLPYEGDVIVEGRWGNSIRLGSTTPKSLNMNNWSNYGLSGDPIFIIRNGQGSQSEEGFIPISEDINNMESSIFLTSTQQIPITVARQDYTSYSGSSFNPPTSPPEYSSEQIILNSGRLIFNAKSDHILLSAAKTINLNSPESVNIDARELIIQTDYIYLGNASLATEPLMLGNKTVSLLTNLVDALVSLTDELKNLTSDPIIPNKSEPASFTKLNIKAAGLNSSLKVLKKQLETPNSITSKYNYTL